MQAGLLAACAKELGQPKERLQLDLKDQKEFVQKVNMSVPIPVGMTAIGGTTSGGKMGAPQSSLATSELNETVYRDMPVRKISADCRVSG